ncbi:MAG: hypothetical protein LV477_04980 [Candidatus Nitrosotalea sp.]|jgi:hypothetical protein|nr:hypothetical protein [Candidatus Nitrosotalea sp.]
MSDYTKKVFVDIAIQKALLESGSVTLEKVNNQLFEIYHSSLSECYDNPEYLREVLKDIFDKSHTKIIDDIKIQLQSVSYHKQVEIFLQKLGE